MTETDGLMYRHLPSHPSQKVTDNRQLIANPNVAGRAAHVHSFVLSGLLYDRSQNPCTKLQDNFLQLPEGVFKKFFSLRHASELLQNAERLSASRSLKLGRAIFEIRNCRRFEKKTACCSLMNSNSKECAPEFLKKARTSDLHFVVLRFFSTRVWYG